MKTETTIVVQQCYNLFIFLVAWQEKAVLPSGKERHKLNDGMLNDDGCSMKRNDHEVPKMMEDK